MIKLPNGEEEISLLKFLGKYQYIHINDLKYFFSSKSYYKKRISSLVQKKYIKKIDSYYVLSYSGIQFIKALGCTYNRLNYNTKYLSRLCYISSIAAYYNNCENVNFVPSFSIKNKENLTISSRRYIGILNINKVSFIVYHISKNHDNKYIGSIIYDIQKENYYKNVIVLVDDISRINLNNFVFGINQVLIIEDTVENREKLKYINNINWYNIINKYYNNPFLSGYNFCDYQDTKGKYISYFYFFDTEKVNRINQFLKENPNELAYIICTIEIKEKLIELFKRIDFNIICLEDYIDRKRIVYEK